MTDVSTPESKPQAPAVPTGTDGGLFQNVKDFHKKQGLEHPETFTPWNEKLAALRLSLIDEELREVNEHEEEMFYGDAPPSTNPLMWAHYVKETIDVIYILLGNMVSAGVPFQQAWELVHAANMSKEGSRRADGKILKGDNYVDPTEAIHRLLLEQPNAD